MPSTRVCFQRALHLSGENRLEELLSLYEQAALRREAHHRVRSINGLHDRAPRLEVQNLADARHLSKDMCHFAEGQSMGERDGPHIKRHVARGGELEGGGEAPYPPECLRP